MNSGIFDKRIPSLLAIFFLLLLIVPTVKLVGKDINIESVAGLNPQVENLSISNIQSASFTVAFTTTKDAKALVIVTDNNGLENMILDDRDKPTGIQKEYYTHFITVPNLNENTKYRFKLLINDKIFEDESFVGLTGPDIKSKPIDQNAASGRVYLPNGKVAANSLIILSSNKSQLLSAITENDGTFKITLTGLRGENLDNFKIFNLDDSLELKLYNQNLMSKVLASYEVIQKLPNIVLGNNYKFSKFKDKQASQSAFFNNQRKSLSDEELEDYISSQNQTTQKNSNFDQTETNSNVLSSSSNKSKENINSKESEIIQNSFLVAGFSLVLIFMGVSLLFAL